MTNNKPSWRGVIVPLFVCALLAILIGKLVVNDHTQDPFLYAYGIIVTCALVMVISVRYLFYVDPYFKALKILKDKPHLAKDKPYVSIMVAVFNEERFIARCLNSMLAQTYENFEIIVANDSSTDRTAEILRAYETNPRVRVLNLPKNMGKKKALAEAILEAKGSIFVFTDSDSILGVHAVERVVDIFKTQPNIGGISGHTRAYNAEKNLLTHIQDTWYEGQFSIRKAFESSFGAVTCVSGPLAAFRREAVFNLIPLWINDTFLGSEFKFATDRTKTALVLAHKHFTKLARKRFPNSPFITRETHMPQHWAVVYTRAAQAKTNVPEDIEIFLKQQIRWKKSFIRNIWLTGSFYWQKPLPVAIMYYLRALFVFAGPFIVFRHLVWLPMSGDLYSAALYLSGILFVGFTFAALHKIENPQDDVWVYRPLMNLISTFILSWLIFYSLITVKKMVWQRG
ncbi:MAG TPA: glycosyltransferase [Candidatus Paceibacterota bacterium]